MENPTRMVPIMRMWSCSYSQIWTVECCCKRRKRKLMGGRRTRRLPPPPLPVMLKKEVCCGLAVWLLFRTKV